MTLIAIVAATLAAGIGSVWLAAALMSLGALGGAGDNSGAPGRRIASQHLLSLAAGALLATSFMHLLPEAFESAASPKGLFFTLLVGLVFFFLLDKAELWHHGHEHHQQHHGHAHHHEHAADGAHGAGHAHAPAAGGWAVLTGDSVHCFGDGILIASAFVADMRLGLVAALSVLAHEVPHHVGDLVVLRRTSHNRRAAVLKVSLAGAVTTLGGVTGWFLVDTLRGGLPYFLVVASSSFIYVALADLIPQLQRRLGARETAAQVAWLLAGIGLVAAVAGALHFHD